MNVGCLFNKISTFSMWYFMRIATVEGWERKNMIYFPKNQAYQNVRILLVYYKTTFSWNDGHYKILAYCAIFDNQNIWKIILHPVLTISILSNFRFLLKIAGTDLLFVGWSAFNCLFWCWKIWFDGRRLWREEEAISTKNIHV